MMLIVLTASFAPGIALLMFLYFKDELEYEPLTAVFKSFIIGMLLVIPVTYFQFVSSEVSDFFDHPAGAAFIQTGFIEEMVKWSAVYLFVFLHNGFQRQYDGIIYASAVALGFASLENLLYIQFIGLDIAFYRALFPVSVHALLGVVMGYYFARAKFHHSRMRPFLGMALLIPIILHGLYQFILIQLSEWVYALIPFMIFLWMFAMRKVKKANDLEIRHLEAGAVE
ncbi:glutamic-type intramembrane protease PrsW [Salisediminibacterium halotolerans]|uniref:glutamic-type intramembrane protease PrsW n=1 Tax=Salisediminibacterium halotolerans TaxID=517425 RepID=UPI000F1A11AB|nr:glutamic-type intramembrane protease PrsW [Salisediminibacterium halotolerans]RLJ77964.1 RsiW-degrading membrane proteinase PrsW (M82 family) [Actinophytocola xinjiangensis]RPE88698.1 RsiW-degrading membrane proteinase PrsW (M82 family) [Salisediminibacterium halotolerans]TWG36941.1 RsiW-degrading membrane proteinase PrsW (M82 family) [Salisediminibacterium halotolerans]GEL08098.1 protease PrsW [Salisediminibacterium halotolerans]